MIRDAVRDDRPQSTPIFDKWLLIITVSLVYVDHPGSFQYFSCYRQPWASCTLNIGNVGGSHPSGQSVTGFSGRRRARFIGDGHIVSGILANTEGKTLLLLKPRGFCAGVVRAIDVVRIALEAFGPPIYV